MTDPDDRGDEDLRSIKLKLPMVHVVRLESLRLLRHTTLSHVLADALDHYFATTARVDLESVYRQVGDPHRMA